MKAVIYASTNHARAAHVARAMQEGMRRHNTTVTIETGWRGEVKGDVAIAYGWAHEAVFKAYPHFAYWDLGYWNRMPSKDKGGAREGAYRLAVDGWDTADTMQRGCPSDRFKASGIELCVPIVPSRGPVLVAGMSGKAAGTHGFKPGQWERETVDQLAALKADIIFRPKSGKHEKVEPIADVLARCSLAVMHHSNVAVDALIAGIPVYSRKGVGKIVSYATLAETVANRGPVLAEHERRAMLCDIAYAQWTPAEMRSGAAWAHIKGLL